MANVKRNLVLNAADLMGDRPEDNPEYDKAIIELVSQTLGIGGELESRYAVRTILSALKEN